MDVLLTIAAHVPDLRYHLFSLPALIKNDHAFKGRLTGVIVRFKSERSIVFTLSGTLFSVYGYRIDSRCRENACVVLVPGQPPSKSAININDFHCAAGHSHEDLLRNTAGNKGSSSRGSCRNSDSRHLPPAMPATGKPRRSVRLKGTRWTPPRPLQGGPDARREVRFKGARWTPPWPR